ncbi:MAG: hypothetical protein LAP85_17390 [Acidobacteriia bacterium]|nr:hypothetical protein [Terriglobia bacterium]
MMHVSNRRSRVAFAVVASVAWLWRMPPAEAVEPKLVILVETGQSRDGLPVLGLDRDPAKVTGVLSRGFAGRLLRLYQYEQEYLRRASGSQPEPAYLLLSSQQGGFPRFGFYLDKEEKRHAGYVDLFRASPLQGRFGSMDQIFPHELAHIVVRQLAGFSEQGGSNQMHAIGVRTDPYQAFQEGFAEHFQIMAIDDPDADQATKALASNVQFREMAEGQIRRYRREMQARWAPAGPLRMGFLIWFSGTEQVWRYFAVKANAFAHAPELPEGLLAAKDLYPAYLLQNVVPGNLQAAPKPVPILLATEGVVSSLFYRWGTSEAVRQHYRDEEFYARFGASRTQVTPLENCYLKLFHVLFTKKPLDTAALINAYKSVFPDESVSIDALVQETLMGQPLEATPAIWLANRDFQTGTSLFDQFRSIPRTHTFDLNAATLVDLLGVPGMTRRLAELILKNAPYSSLTDLGRLPAYPQAMLDQFIRMSQEMDRLRASSAEDETMLNLSTILWSYGRRALIILALATAGGAFLYRRARPAGWMRAVSNGFAASLFVLALAWLTMGTGAHVAFLGPVVLLGIPAALWHMARHRRPALAAKVLLAWAGAAIPAVLLAYPWL